MTELSIVIVNWNTRELLAQCLRSVYGTTAGWTIDVLVVDNGSIDGTSEMVRKYFPQVTLIENSQNMGFAVANNQALREGTGRYVLLLNSDTLVLDGALQQMVEFMDNHLGAAAAGPCLLNSDGSYQPSSARFANIWTELLLVTGLGKMLFGPEFPHLPVTDRAREIGWVSGACIIIRRAALEDVGLLDERFFMYVEEVDWCWRARARGWSVHYVPQARVIHFGGQSSQQASEAMLIEFHRARLLFHRIHYGTVQSMLVQGLITASLAARAVLQHLRYLLRCRDDNCHKEIRYHVVAHSVLTWRFNGK